MLSIYMYCYITYGCIRSPCIWADVALTTSTTISPLELRRSCYYDFPLHWSNHACRTRNLTRHRIPRWWLITFQTPLGQSHVPIIDGCVVPITMCPPIASNTPLVKGPTNPVAGKPTLVWYLLIRMFAVARSPTTPSEIFGILKPLRSGSFWKQTNINAMGIRLWRLRAIETSWKGTNKWGALGVEDPFIVTGCKGSSQKI